jgi:septal ring factor EnvC (AmiA/AmiB activator)
MEDTMQKLYTQAEVNRIAATEARRKKKQLEKAQAELQNLTTGQTESELGASLKKAQSDLQSLDETFAAEKAAMEAAHKQQITEMEERGRNFETQYRNSTIDRELLEASHRHNAHSAEQLSAQLKPLTKMIDGKVVVEFAGEQLTTDEAVSRMRSQPEDANLFNATVCGGLGANSSRANFHCGGLMSARQIRALTTEQYRQIRSEHPDYLGLGKKQ